MAQVKTAISLDTGLFDAGEQLAQKLQLTRSGLYARALAEFIERRANQEFLDGLNSAYQDMPDPEDTAVLRGIQRTMRRVSDPWE